MILTDFQSYMQLFVRFWLILILHAKALKNLVDFGFYIKGFQDFVEFSVLYERGLKILLDFRCSTTRDQCWLKTTLGTIKSNQLASFDALPSSGLRFFNTTR